MYLIYTALLSCAVACIGTNAAKGLTKRMVTFTRLEKCPEQGLETWICSANLVKAGKKRLMNGNCTWPIDIDENMKVRLTSSLFKDGQYHDGYLDVMIDGCTQFDELSNGFLKALFASSDIEKNECPYPKGTYVYKNFQMEGTPTMPETVPNGLYKLTIYVFDNKENLLGCWASYVQIKLDSRKKNG